jgi:hypothetical protein
MNMKTITLLMVLSTLSACGAENFAGMGLTILGERIGYPAKLHEKDYSGWDRLILLRGDQIAPGETKRFGIVFLSLEIVPAFRSMDKFYLCPSAQAVGETRAV